MASLIDRIADIFKPKKDTISVETTQGNKKTGTVDFSAGNATPASTKTTQVSTPKTTPAAQVFKPAQVQTTQAAGFYTPTGSLAQRAYKRDLAIGNVSATTPEKNDSFFSAYYKVLDDPKYSKMYTDLEKLKAGSNAKNGKDFKSQYDSGMDNLDAEIKAAKKQYGKNSDEYRALQQFKEDYTKLGSQIQANYSYKDSQKLSRQLDNTIDTVFAGYTNDPGFQAKVEKGKELIEKHPDVAKRFNHDMKGASDKQMNLLYAVAADEDIAGARDFYDRFLNPTVSRIGALRDFSSGISSNGKVQRVFSAASGAAAGAVANSAIVGDGVQKGIDVLTGKAKALDDDVLAGDFTVQDSVDNILRSEFTGINQADLDQYGKAAFDQMSTTLPGSDWLQDADEDATDYQKQLLGYVYLASDKDEDVARDLWETIKARDSEIRQTVNGSTYGSTSQNAVKSQLYQEYLDKNKLMLGLYKSVVTTGSQLDRTLLSFIPVIGTALSLGTMALDVYGKTYSEDILNGRAEDGKTAGHAATAALLEVAMEKLLGGINHIPGLAFDEVSKRFVKNLANPWARGAVNTLLRLHGEGTEEALTDVANAISTGLWFGEGNIAQRVKQGFEDDFDAQQMLESYIYGAISAFFLGGMSTVGEIHADFNYRELGQHLNTLESTDKLIDTILNTKIDEKAGKLSKKLYDEAKELAQGMKDGKLKKNDVNVGEMFANFAKSGGDVQWLTNPDTVNYNKDTLTEENFIAGATSRLAELGADTSLAADIARWAMGQAPSQEAFNKIKSDPKAAQVLQELINPLDMEQDNALTRAAQSTTRNVTGDKTYDTLVASNPDQTVVNPATQQLISLGVELEEAQGIGDVIAKVMAGETITEDEAELVSVSNAAVRSVLSSVANVELAEDATIGAVMDALNGVATEAAKVKEQQAAVAEGAEAAARARMPIPPNTSGTVSMAGVEMTHDQFIDSFMQKPGATLEQAEKAWENSRTVSAALNGEEENNGTTPGKQEGRNPDLAGRNPIPAATQRTAESGRTADTGGTEQSGRVAEDRQSADLRRGYTEDQVIKAFNSKQRAFMRSCLDAGFKTTKLIKGPILRQGVDKDGNPVTYEVNALVDDDGNLVIRWDNPYASPLRVALHERIHLWLSAMQDSERAAFVKQALQDIFGDNTAAFDAMYKAYADVYAKAYTGLTGDVFAAHVMEEMLADMYAGMNNYGADAGSYQSQAEMYVQQSGLREKFFGEEGGFSFDEQFSLNDPFRGDVDRSKPPETRPFPGEKAMHDNMELLSLTSMAQGANFELRLNSQGQPYELIDKKTGKRVEHVTGEMMIDTPLGNIVQLAVDNGNIDADEAAQQRDMLASAMNLIVDYDDAALVWELVGSQMFSAVKANSDKQYNKTIDFSTICKKTMAIVDAMSETMKKLGRGLTRREVEIVYEEVGKKGLATPCPVCYVFSRWMGIGGLLDQMNRFQVKYGDMSEEDIVAFMTRIEDKAWEYAKKNPKSTYFDKDAPHTRDHMLIGKVISDMKSGPNSKAAAAIETLNAHQQALATIAELEKAKEKATPAMAKRYGEMIRQLRYNVKSEKALAEAEAKMQAAEADIEPYEEYQWLAKTMMISDSSQVNEDGESVGNWKRNPNFKPVPQDILFDLNKGAEFAKDYPLSWAFRTGKGCAAGKAIAPYSDARVGETIQGVATDVKNIRVELDENQHDSFVQDYMQKNNATREVAEEAWQNRPHNEFLTGDTKTQQKTLKTARKKQRQQNLIGGMRYQSTSDFRYEFGSDYLMTFLEMQALGANVQLYTKVIEAVDFLASTGADCNLSVMPLGDGYEEYIDPKTGEKKQRLIFSDITGINADAAIKKSQEYDNVQLILVGINDTNIRLALEGDEVTFVIPFHGSGQSVHQIQGLMDLIGEHLDVTKAQDYTSVQSDRAIKDRAEKHPELQAMWDLRMDIIMGKFLTEEQKETLKAWENATSQEEKTALADRLAELGKAQEGLSAEQKARLAKNKHLQKLYNMFYVDTTDPAFYNNLAKEQAEQIFPYEYWIKDGDYAHADENGRVFQEYCASIGVIPRFSGINSKYQKTGFGDFTQDKGYWKLLIDRSMYENVYDEKGNWIGYGKYRPQQQINMTNIDIGDLNPETGKAQFKNGEMSKQYDATRNPEDLAKRDNIVSDSIKRIEAMRGSADVVERNALDRTRVKKGFREKVMKAQSALREADQTAEPESEVVEEQSKPSVWYSVAISDPVFDSENREDPIRSANNNDIFYIHPGDSSWEVEFDEAGNLMNTDYLKDRENGLGFHIFDNPHDDMSKTKGERQQQPADLPEGADRKLPPERTEEKVEKGNPTQRENTRATYGKVGRILEEAFGKERAHNLRILDASSGMGYGVKDLLKMGFKSENVVDLEPFPPPDGSYVPYYRQYGDLMKALQNGTEEPFDVVISNAVINVMAQDARAEIIAALGKFVKPDGHIFINTFKPDNIQSDNYPFYTDLDPNLPNEKRPSTILRRDNRAGRIGEEVFVRAGANMAGNIQKAFYPEELRGFVRDVLNQTGTEGFSFSNVKPIDKKSIGMQTLWVNMNGETVEEQGRKQPPSERFSLSDEQQEKNVDYNNRQNTVGGQLKTRNGSPIKRGGTLNGVTYPIGKVIGDRLYIHKDYVDSAVQANPEFGEALEKAQKKLQDTYPGFEYNCLNYQPKTGQIQFQEAPDFDTAREPVVGKQVNVEANGDISKIKSFGQIWHHKWQWVGDRHPGFAESWNWSKQWLNALKEPSKGGSLAAWNKQLDEYGLPHDGQPRFSIAENQEVFEAPYTSEADWRKAVKDRSIEYTPEMEKRWGLSGGDMTDADAAITEALDKIEEIQARPDRKWFIHDITGLSWYKEGFTNVIDLMNSGENGKKLLKFMLRNVDEKNLNLLSQYLVLHYLPDVRKRSQKEINAFKKIVKARSDQIANERGIGHNLNVSARKTYTLSDIRSMFEQLNDDPENAALAQKIFDWAEELEQRGFIPAPFKFRSISDANGKQWGTKIRYDTNYFNDPRVSDARKAKTILHELIHKYSSYAIDLVHAHDNVGNYASYSLREAYNTLPQNIIQAVYTLDDIYDQIKYDPLFLDANGKPMYGTKNVYEMLAELSNPEFREALKKKTLWQRILDAVKKLFGIDTTNAYDSVSAAFDKLMSSYDLYRVEETYEDFMQRTQNGYDRFSVAPDKKNPFPEGSAEQQMLDMMNKADNPDALEDYINGLIEKRNQSIEHQKEVPPALPHDTLFPVNSKQKEIAQNQLDSLIKKYGLLQKGEKAARDKSYPERTSDTQFVRRTARTAAEAAGIPEYFADQIDQAVLNELLTYTRITDKMANKESDKAYSDLGYKKAIKEWNENRASTNNQPTKYDIAFGERLLIEASRNNDAAVAMKVLADLAAMATQAGQVVQAVRMLKDMGPIGQLYYVQKAVDRINKENAGRIAKGSFQPITIDQKLAEAVVLSNTQKEMEDNMKVLIKSIADQLPVTLKDKWDAWRYLAMLGNPRTHVRNLTGNAIFVPVRFVKDMLAAAGEQFIDPSERTKSVGAKLHSAKYADVREYAKQDFKNMEPYITTGGKMNPLNEIMEARTIFKTPIIGQAAETLRKLNDFLLNKEDIVFLQAAYIDAFTQFVAARGLTAEQLTGPDGGATLNEARQYAALEAQKATYRDFSRLATALNGLRKVPVLGMFLDGLLPFTKTPINILKRGVEYSPVGLAHGVYDALFKVRRGDISAAQAIDEMASGLTGTGVALLGYILASMGLARGADDDDEKKQDLEEAQGHQSYSLEIGDNSYTIDWAAPVALPFFVGVEAHKQMAGDGEGSFWDFCNAMTLLMEPMMSLSMLDGINSTLAAVKSDQNSPLWAVLSNVMASYVSQGAPTFGGQVARTFDPVRRSTYVDKNIEGPALLQRTLQGIQSKIPRLAKEKMAYVDVWGRKDTSSSALWRAFENFASPGYGNKIKETPVDTELMRLYDATGDNSVLPSTVAKYFQVEGERLDLTAKQYEKYKTTTGQTAFKLIGELIDDPVYGSMNDAQKADTVKQLLEAATIIGKKEVAPNYKGTAWVERAVDQDNLETAAVFHTIKAQNTGLSSYQLIESMAWLTPEEQGKLIMSERNNTERKMTDYKKKKYKFILTDEQIAREREIYNGMFWPAYNELIYSPKFLGADVATRASMISDMQTDLNKAARMQLGDELRAEGYTSVLEDDSDVPEQPVDLYSLLNRG